MYNPVLLATSATLVTVQSPGLYNKDVPLPSGDFVKSLPCAINVVVNDSMKIGEDVKTSGRDKKNS
jgi:hypothetical protein